jgi:hypothetical protein
MRCNMRVTASHSCDARRRLASRASFASRGGIAALQVAIFALTDRARMQLRVRRLMYCTAYCGLTAEGTFPACGELVTCR